MSMCCEVVALFQAGGSALSDAQAAACPASALEYHIDTEASSRATSNQPVTIRLPQHSLCIPVVVAGADCDIRGKRPDSSPSASSSSSHK